MLNQNPSEANTSAVFLKSYLECVEELPVDVSKAISSIRELDVSASNIINEIEELSEQITKSSTDEAKEELFSRLTEILKKLQEIQSEKVHFSQMLFERVDVKSRTVETNYQNDIATKTEDIAATSTAKNEKIVQQVLSHLPLKNPSKPASSASSSTNHSDNNNGNNERNGSKRLRRTRMDTELERAETPKPVVKVETTVTIKEKTTSTSAQQATTSANKNKNTSTASAANTSTGSNNGNGKKKMKKKKKVSNSNSSNTTTKQQTSSVSIHEEVTIEEDNDDEETYCLCGQVSYGEMILCENDACKIEWFHFSCVSLTSKPKGRWYCPSCRGDRPNVLNKNLRKKS